MTTAADLIEQGASGLHPTDDAATARAAARDKGWRVVDLDTSHGADKPYFLEVCRQAFDLPQWFGGNWDALADSLTDINDASGTLVIWTGAGGLEAVVRETAAEIFAERVERTSRGLGAFLVLVAAGPDERRTMNDL